MGLNMETFKTIFAVFNIAVFFYGLIAAAVYQHSDKWDKATFFLLLAVWASMSFDK
jgi:hypothetical protein